MPIPVPLLRKSPKRIVTGGWGKNLELVPVRKIVEKGYICERIHRSEGIFEEARRQMFYEKPYQKRNRLSWERCKRIYNADMQRKIEFVMRKNRSDPWPR